MEKNREEEFNAFIRGRIREEGLEKPSSDFTKNIISRIEEEQLPSPVLVYRPLISKRVWYAMAFVIVGLFSLLFLNRDALDLNWISPEKMEKLNQLQLNFLGKLPSLNISTIYVYAFVGLAFFAGLQVYLLKNHFEKKYYLD